MTAPIRVLLVNPALSRLLVAFGVLTIAEWGYVTALAIEAFRRDGALAVGLVGLRMFYAAIGSVLGIPFIERRPGTRMLTTIAGARMVIVATSAVLVAGDAPLAPLLVLVAVDAFVSALYRPAQSALIPALARTPTELAGSAAALSTVKTLSQGFGATVGATLLVVTTPSWVFFGAAVLFLSTSVMTRSFVQPRFAISDAADGRGAKYGIRGMYRLVHKHGVVGILVLSGLRTFVRGMWISIAVIVSLELLRAGSAGVGVLMLAAGVGSVTAVPLVTSLINRPRLGTPAAVALITCGAPLALIAGLPALNVAVVLVTAWGVGMAVSDVATSALLFRLLETPLLPRVTGAIESAKLALEGLGAFLGPVLVSVIGVRAALVFTALPLPIVVIVGWTRLHRMDRSAGDRHHLLRLLHSVPCLAHLDIAALESLAGRVTSVVVAAGIDVIRQDDPGDAFYIVLSGTAEVSIDGFAVGIVEPGVSFGEKALLRSVPRMATVTSRTPMELLVLSRDDFLAGLSLRETSPNGPRHQPVSGSRGETRRDRIELLSTVSLLSHLESAALQRLADLSVVDRWPAGASILRRGDAGDRFFILLEGRAVVSLDNHHVASELLPGDQFGEIALIHGVPRTADVTASSPTVTLSLHRDDFLPAVRSRMLLG